MPARARQFTLQQITDYCARYVRIGLANYDVVSGNSDQIIGEPKHIYIGLSINEQDVSELNFHQLTVNYLDQIIMATIRKISDEIRNPSVVFVHRLRPPAPDTARSVSSNSGVILLGTETYDALRRASLFSIEAFCGPKQV